MFKFGEFPGSSSSRQQKSATRGDTFQMKLLGRLCLIALIASLISSQASAQVGSPDTGSYPGKLENQVHQLENAIAAQQHAMAEQQKQISEQRQELQMLRQRMAEQPQATSGSPSSGSPEFLNATLTSPKPTSPSDHALTQGDADKPKESPLSFHIGGAEFTPGGFVDLTAFWRNTNPGTGYGTNFFSIPFHNTVPGQLSETRFTAENSRISLKVTDNFKGNDVTGYYEMDFHGNDPMKRLNPFACSTVIFGGIESSWRDTGTSTSAGPSYLSASAMAVSTWSGVSAFTPNIPAPSAIFVKSGLCRSVVKSSMPAAFISSSTKASESFLKTITFTGN